ncbi:MAG: hypothetical protein VZR11_12775 [Succinimonas sp.]|nr:hypothetical protein [Succinimonas sp.]
MVRSDGKWMRCDFSGSRICAVAGFGQSHRVQQFRLKIVPECNLPEYRVFKRGI